MLKIYKIFRMLYLYIYFLKSCCLTCHLYVCLLLLLPGVKILDCIMGVAVVPSKMLTWSQTNFHVPISLSPPVKHLLPFCLVARSPGENKAATSSKMHD